MTFDYKFKFENKNWIKIVVADPYSKSINFLYSIEEIRNLAKGASQVLIFENEKKWAVSKPNNFVINNLKKGKGLGSNPENNINMYNVFWYWRSSKNYHWNFYAFKGLEYPLDFAIWWAKGQRGLHLGSFANHADHGYKSSWNGTTDKLLSIYIDDFEEYRNRFLNSLQVGDWIKMDMGLVDHHAIYSGKGYMIERNWDNGYAYKAVDWNWEWKLHKSPENEQHRKEIIKRAEEKIQNSYDYNILYRNCDSFCNYCYKNYDFSWQALKFPYLWAGKIKSNIFGKKEKIYSTKPHGYEIESKLPYWCAIANTNFGLIPGKSRENICYYSYNGKEYTTDNFKICSSEVLSESEGGHPPGCIKDGNYLQYCAIASTDFGNIPGRAQDQVCYYAYQGKEYSTTKFCYLVIE